MVVLKHRVVGAADWSESPMIAQPYNDRWTGIFVVESRGKFEYTIEGWVDRFASWHYELTRKTEAGLDVPSELLEGAELVLEGSKRARGADIEMSSRPGPTSSRPEDPGASGSRPRPESRIGRDDGPLSRPESRIHLRACPCRSSLNASGLALAPGTRCSRDRPRRADPASTARSRQPRRGPVLYVASVGFPGRRLPPADPSDREVIP